MQARWFWGIASMIPFLWIVWELFAGLSKSIGEPARGRPWPGEHRALGRRALGGRSIRFVYFAGAIGLDGGLATTTWRSGYTIADIVAKAVFGVLIYLIAVRKSQGLLLTLSGPARPPSRPSDRLRSTRAVHGPPPGPCTQP